jgi:pimeloyl-ACP methyl ester carboxylesterase
VDIILVHGSYHGAWCWDRFAPELEIRGHRVTAVDMPISDPRAGAATYAEQIIDSTQGLADPVLVGHSMAGLVIPLVAAQRPVRRMIFLAAFLPRPGVSAADQRREEPIDGTMPLRTSEWTDLGDDVWMVGPNTATELFFHDAPPDIAAWATSRLRPQSYLVMNEPSPLAEWPRVASDYVVCRDDRAINPAWGRSAARERLGVDAVELDGGHSPFLTRPAELARVVDSLLAADRERGAPRVHGQG